jgi:hypothetical protein
MHWEKKKYIYIYIYIYIYKHFGYKNPWEIIWDGRIILKCTSEKHSAKVWIQMDQERIQWWAWVP